MKAKNQNIVDYCAREELPLRNLDLRGADLTDFPWMEDIEKCDLRGAKLGDIDVEEYEVLISNWNHVGIFPGIKDATLEDFGTDGELSALIQRRLSKRLTVALMRADCVSYATQCGIPLREAVMRFHVWKLNGICPFSSFTYAAVRENNVERRFSFRENREWWSWGRVPTDKQLLQMIKKELMK